MSLFLDGSLGFAPDDYVSFTFFAGYMAMLAASVFFFFERSRVSSKSHVVNRQALITARKEVLLPCFDSNYGKH